jgi:hypothetical protein
MTRLPRLLVPLLLALGLACSKEKTCTSDLALCDGACTALATDPASCGACGHACGAGESCYAGACFCPFTTTCGGACVDLESDPAHCGACDVACAAPQVCTTPDGGATACAGACAAGQTACGRACVNLQKHRQNCGACGRSCGSNERCSAGRCVADLYLACFNTDEVREATGALAAAGVPIAVAPGPSGLAWTGDLLAMSSAVSGGETVAVLHFDPPGLLRRNIYSVSSANADIEYLAEHENLLYVSHTSLGTLLILTPGGAVVDEVRLAPTGAQAPDPQGIAFDDGGRAYVALNGSGEVVVLDVSRVLACALGAHSRPCTSEVARIDLTPLASPGGLPMPSRIAVAGGRAFVSLWNLELAPVFFGVPDGSTGRLAAIDTATATLDAAFAGTANGLIDLGPDCLDASDVAVLGSTLYVTCGAFAYPNIIGAGIVPVDLSGSVAQVLPKVAAAPGWAPGKLAFCGSTGYVGDKNSGRVTVFDPASGSTTLGEGVELCPRSPAGYAFVADIACGR